MTYGFRVCFRLTGEGSLTSGEEFIEFEAATSGLPLKLSSGSRGVAIGKNDRFSVSGGGFNSQREAHCAADSVRHALLLTSAKMRRGLDLGQDSLRAFGISDYGKQMLAEQFGAQMVAEDHLGITVYPTDPKPIFVRMDMTGTVSSQAQTFVDGLASSVGCHRLATTKAETAAALYALSHFVSRAPARFLLLFIAIEALLDPSPRSVEAVNHVDSLIDLTRAAVIGDEEKSAICSVLSFLRTDSIAITGRKLAQRTLGEALYDGLAPGKFFGKVYKVRNDLVHRGLIDAEAMHVLVGELDRFVADIVSMQIVKS